MEGDYSSDETREKAKGKRQKGVSLLPFAFCLEFDRS
jgi:hypothetical protein